MPQTPTRSRPAPEQRDMATPTTPEHEPHDLPSLTPSKSPSGSSTDSDSDSSFTFDDDDLDDVESQLGLQSLDLQDANPSETDGSPQSPATSVEGGAGAGAGGGQANREEVRTPHSSANTVGTMMTLSEPPGGRRMRKRSLTELVALKWGGGRGEGDVDEEERGRLALDLDAYINSGDPDSLSGSPRIPPRFQYTHVPPLQPALSLLPRSRIDRRGLPLPPRSDWLHGPVKGKTSRGFIPGPGVAVKQSSEKDTTA